MGYPAYTTSAGWMGYSEDGIRSLVRQALAEGWTHFKVKVGGVPADDERRVGLVREEIGPDRTLMIDANQNWGVDEAIARVNELAWSKVRHGDRAKSAGRSVGLAQVKHRSAPPEIDHQVGQAILVEVAGDGTHRGDG